MPSEIFWFFLVMLLSISTFGIWICFVFLFAVLSSLIGAACSLYLSDFFLLKPSNSCKKTFSRTKVAYSYISIVKIVIQMEKIAKIPKCDQGFTGSYEIDVPIQEILFYVTRDFVQSWYKEVSSNKEFTSKLNDMFSHLIKNFSISSQRVNWISFITQNVVRDFTTHLRLYRYAQNRFSKQKREKLETYLDIESAFFALESEFNNNTCRENVCISIENQKEYIQCLCNVILYILLPPDDFNNKIFCHFLRELLACSVFEPLISQFSDPDVINQNMMWMCKDHPACSRSLVSVLRRTENKEELLAFQQISKHEMKVQNSKDTADKEVTDRKRLVKSISFVRDIAQQRYEKLCGLLTSSSEFYLNYDATDSSNISPKRRKFISLPFDVIISNNIALHYFTQYLANMAADNYIYFYHSVEGFRTTVEMMKTECGPENSENIREELRNFALQIYHSYLSSNATSKVDVDEDLLKKLLSRIKTGDVMDLCFDEVQDKVHSLLENEFYLNGFKDTKQYVKLLAELDLINNSPSASDVDSLSSSKSEEEEKFSCYDINSTDDEVMNELLAAELSSSEFEFPGIPTGQLHDGNKEVGVLFAEVHSTGITHHAGKTFAVYAIAISHQPLDGPQEKWFVVRRYSEFCDFHKILVKKFPVVAQFNFPFKKPLNCLTRQLMEKRCHMLNDFMKFLLSPHILSACNDLNGMVYNFLQPNVCETNKKLFVRTVGNCLNPLKTSIGTVGSIVRLIPDTFFELKGGLMKALSRSNEGSYTQRVNEAKYLSDINDRTDDIPFQIILQLMDEVFNLRDKDLWFRRRIMTLLRQIIQTMQGGSINRKIKDHIQSLTSPAQIGQWLTLMRKNIWPDGVLADSAPERDDNTKMRTRIATKMLLFSAIPDELKRVIGYETSFRGAMLVFDMFQHPSLNRRLVLVLLESLLSALFPDNRITEISRKHFSSAQKSSQLKDDGQKDELNNKMLDEFSSDDFAGQVLKRKFGSGRDSKMQKSEFFLKDSPKNHPKEPQIKDCTFPRVSSPKQTKYTKTAVFYVESRDR